MKELKAKERKAKAEEKKPVDVLAELAESIRENAERDEVGKFERMVADNLDLWAARWREVLRRSGR